MYVQQYFEYLPRYIRERIAMDPPTPGLCSGAVPVRSHYCTLNQNPTWKASIEEIRRCYIGHVLYCLLLLSVAWG